MVTKGTLLYVEDEDDDVLFMRLAVKEAGEGLCLKHVQNGQEAIAYLSGQEPYSDRVRFPLPEIVLLDLNLPVISGFEVLRWVRAEPRFERLPVVLFSSSGRMEDREKARLLKADDYLTKPASGLDFRRIVRQISERWLLGVSAKESRA